jgi:aldose 1-epimerase
MACVQSRPDALGPDEALPSGRQVELAHGDQQATVVEVGATLRACAVGGRPVLDGFAVDETATGGRGEILMPWPNRIADGTYDFDGQTHRLALSEPAAGNAIHGLVRYANWTVAEAGPDHVVMSHRLHPQPGYPFVLDLVVAYRLADDGLTVTMQANNRGRRPCPFGAGAHPYLRLGRSGVGELRLRVPAATAYESDDRGIPIRRRSVEGSALDFRGGSVIGDTRLDTAFTDLGRDPDGRAVVELAEPGGESVRLWMDERFTHLMLFTGDTLDPERRRQALAVEPMSCAPNAFRTGDGLLALPPGGTFVGRWGILRGT